MIVCHCNVLTDADILSTLDHKSQPRTAVQAYRCLGCAPDCGRCMLAVRQILAEARTSACAIGCKSCPGNEHPSVEVEVTEILMIAAE